MEKGRIIFPKTYNFRSYSLNKRDPKTIRSLIRESRNKEEFKSLVKNFSNRDRQKVRERTKNQSDSEVWFLYRQAVITGTIIRRVIKAAERGQNDENLNKAISKLGGGFTCEAIEYGLANENNALRVLWKEFCKDHYLPLSHKVGLCLDPELPILGGSPDLIVSCMCCSKEENKRHFFICEAKCPFVLKDCGIKEWWKLPYLTESCQLDKRHSYYYQQMLYCGVMGYSQSLFIIWTPEGHLTLKLDFDQQLFNVMKRSAEEYYFKFYLEEWF